MLEILISFFAALLIMDKILDDTVVRAAHNNVGRDTIVCLYGDLVRARVHVPIW